MNWSKLFQPAPLLIPLALLGVTFFKCWRVKRWPETDKCVEIIAFSAGIFAACSILWKAFIIYAEDTTMAWALFAGAIVMGLGSVRGAWVVFSSIQSRVNPKVDADCPHKEKVPNKS